MKITGLSTAVVEANLDYTYVRLYTDEDGLEGTGECFPAPGLTAILGDMEGLLIGRDPRELERNIRYLARKGSGAGSSAGIIWNAISGIDAALHDIVGKFYGIPVYQLLGGKIHDSVRVYADSHAGENKSSISAMHEKRVPKWMKEGEGERPPEIYMPEAYAKRAKEVVGKGFDAMKFDLDYIVIPPGDELYRPLTNTELGKMETVARAVREAVGDEVDVAWDCHFRFKPADAIRIAHAIESTNPLWLEDPCPPENWRHIAEVKRASQVRILTGENLYLVYGVLPLLEAQAIDFIAPDVQKCGGVAESKKIADIADRYGVSLAPHNISSPLGLMAAAHVCAASANFAVLEYHGLDVPFWNDLIEEEPIIQGGRIAITVKPGIGVTLNESAARQYAKPGERWFRE